MPRVIPSRLPATVFLYEPRGRVIPGHRHDELEANLVIAGRARWLVGDRRYDIGPRSLVWLFPDQHHVLVDLSRDFAMWILVVQPRALRRWCRSADDRVLLARDPPGGFARRIGERDAALLERVFADVAGDPPGERQAHALAYATLSAWRAFRRAAEGAARPLHPGVERAAQLLGDADDPLPRIAARCGLSPSRLRHLFRAQVGQSPVEFRARRRLERFLAVAADGRRRLDACAAEAGFGSYPQFHRVFRRLMGVSPGAWARARAAARA